MEQWYFSRHAFMGQNVANHGTFSKEMNLAKMRMQNGC